VGGVVPSVQLNLGDLRDVITKGSYLPLTSFKFYPDHTWIYVTETYVSFSLKFSLKYSYEFVKKIF